MTVDKRIADQTRNDILNTLSDDETRSVSMAEAGRIPAGEEFLDLEHVERGVQQATIDRPAAHLLPRAAVGASTWAKILTVLETPIAPG